MKRPRHAAAHHHGYRRAGPSGRERLGSQAGLMLRETNFLTWSLSVTLAGSWSAEAYLFTQESCL